MLQKINIDASEKYLSEHYPYCERNVVKVQCVKISNSKTLYYRLKNREVFFKITIDTERIPIWLSLDRGENFELVPINVFTFVYIIYVSLETPCKIFSKFLDINLTNLTYPQLKRIQSQSIEIDYKIKTRELLAPLANSYRNDEIVRCRRSKFERAQVLAEL